MNMHQEFTSLAEVADISERSVTYTRELDQVQLASDLLASGGLTASHKLLPIGEAARLLFDLYCIKGSLTRLATEKDDTFRVGSSDGRQYILKVSNPAEDPEEIALEIELMRHIRATDGTLPIPTVVPNQAGMNCSTIVDEVGQQRVMRLLTYLEGWPLDRTQSSVQEREKLGQVLARLRLATADFSHPRDSRVLAWDVRHVLGLRHLVVHVDGPDRQSSLFAGLDRIARLHERISRLRMQVVHNDFSKSNILVDHLHGEFVTGIIDFGDAVRTAIAVDVSTALQYQLPQDPIYNDSDIFVHGRDLLRGYLSVTELTDEELALIPHLVMARVIARTIITTRRVQLFPENASYIFRNTEPGWVQLDWFLRRTTDEISEVLSWSC